MPAAHCSLNQMLLWDTISKVYRYGGTVSREEEIKMNNFAIIADPASGMSSALRERFGIDDIIPGHVTFPDGTDHLADPDWTTVNPDEYFGSMAKKKAIYKTGAPNSEEIKETAEKFLKEGRDVLLITLSSGMSGTYNICCAVRNELKAEYPENKLVVVDSLRFSAMMILMNIKASQMRAEGKSIEETAKWIEENRNRFRQAGPLNDLMFLARTKRISGAKAFFGQLVGVNALGDYAPNGVSMVLTNVKGTDKALRAAVEYIKQTIEGAEDQIVLISHSFRAKEAEKLTAMVESEIKPAEIIQLRADMLCGANIGPGMVAAFYFGKEATADMAWEKEVMQKIAENLK